MIAALLAMPLYVNAQWAVYHDPIIPRTPDGKPNLSARAPRLNGKPDLSGIWQAANPNRVLAQTLRWSGNPSTPYHCDGIFVPRTWLPRLKSCRVVRGSRWTKLSDHNPVVAEFQTVPNNPVVQVSRS